jgi:hypothetical protein
MSHTGQAYGGQPAVHAPGGSGGDGQSLGQLLGMDGGQGAHSSLSQALGLDQNGHGHAGGMHGGADGAPSQSSGWNSALQSVTLSDALQGLYITPNQLHLLLFLGFIGWLFVIYWIRHHEPLANDVLGMRAVSAQMTAQDRQLLAGTKYAFPESTNSETGDIYVPGVQDVQLPPFAASLDKPGSVQAAPRMPLPAPPVPPMPAPEPQPTPLSAAPVQQMTTQAPAQSGYGVLPAPGVYVPSFGQPSGQSAFLAPAAAAGSRPKMIVNR